MDELILSVFPGIDLLGRAFEEEGFCVVRGPDALWGGNIKTFHPPAGPWGGIIGGPPCQCFTKLRHIILAKGQQLKENLIPEFERVVAEARPIWFLMENVPEAPEPYVDGYAVRSICLNNRWLGGVQNRERRFSFGIREAINPRGVWLDLSEDIALFEASEWERAVVATSSKEGALAKSQEELRSGISPRLKRASALPGQMTRRTVSRCAVLQGLPADFLEDAPFTQSGKYLVIGNGVPIPMGKALAKAIRKAMGSEWK